MSLSTLNYGRNLVRLWRQAPWLHPRVVIYHVTARCNLNCVYCEDFGARRNQDLRATSTPAARNTSSKKPRWTRPFSTDRGWGPVTARLAP